MCATSYFYIQPESTGLKFESLLVVEQNIGAFDVSVEKVLLVAVIKTLQQLSHEWLDVALVEMDQAGLKQTHQVMVHVLKYKIESTWDKRIAV